MRVLLSILNIAAALSSALDNEDDRMAPASYMLKRNPGRCADGICEEIRTESLAEVDSMVRTRGAGDYPSVEEMTDLAHAMDDLSDFSVENIQTVLGTIENARKEAQALTSAAQHATESLKTAVHKHLGSALQDLRTDPDRLAPAIISATAAKMTEEASSAQKALTEYEAEEVQQREALGRQVASAEDTKDIQELTLAITSASEYPRVAIAEAEAAKQKLVAEMEKAKHALELAVKAAEETNDIAVLTLAHGVAALYPMLVTETAASQQLLNDLEARQAEAKEAMESAMEAAGKAHDSKLFATASAAIDAAEKFPALEAEAKTAKSSLDGMKEQAKKRAELEAGMKREAKAADAPPAKHWGGQGPAPPGWGEKIIADKITGQKAGQNTRGY